MVTVRLVVLDETATTTVPPAGTAAVTVMGNVVLDVLLRAVPMLTRGPGVGVGEGVGVGVGVGVTFLYVTNAAA
jgi:hypothetical protein